MLTQYEVKTYSLFEVLVVHKDIKLSSKHLIVNIAMAMRNRSEAILLANVNSRLR